MFLHMQPWITMENIHLGLIYGTMLNFVLTMWGTLIGFCGPMDHKLTEMCRYRYLRIPRSRLAEIWLYRVWPFVMLSLVLLAYQYHWWIVGMFLAFSLALRVLRIELLKRYPERGYLHRPVELIWKDGQLIWTKN